MKARIFLMSVIFFVLGSLFQLFSQRVGVSDSLFEPQSTLHIHWTGDATTVHRLLQLTDTATQLSDADGLLIEAIRVGPGKVDFLINNKEDAALRFLTHGSERMVITSTGNVGIGTTSPSALFSVGSNSQFQVNSSGNLVRINDVSYSWPSSITSGFLRTDASGNLSWSTLTASDIPSGSSNYIQNQISSAQTANFWISGEGRVDALRAQGNTIWGSNTGDANLFIYSLGGARIDLDDDSDGSESFAVRNGGNTIVFEVTEAGNVRATGNAEFNGNLTLSGSAARTVRGPDGSTTDYPLDIKSASGLDITIDDDNDGTSSEFRILKDATTVMLLIPEDQVPMIYPFGTGATQTGGIRFRELAANGTNFTGFRAPDNLGADYMYTLPTTDGSAGQVLSTNGSGILSWVANGGGNNPGLYWSLTGNTGTTDGTHFLGTTDNVPLNFRVNNQKAGRIASNGPVFLGYQAGNNNTDLYNTGVGYQALRDNTSGSSNVAMGYRALRANTTGINNTAVGVDALISNTTGSENIAFGMSALYYNTISRFNIAIGNSALLKNTHGERNIAIGTRALAEQALNTGASGYNANNIAIGFEALYSNAPTATTNGVRNIAIGTLAMRSNVTGFNNIGIGDQALYGGLSPSGNDNIGIGRNSLYSFTSGSCNTTLGSLSLYNVTTGSNNIAIGFQAGDNITTGSNNIIIGHDIDAPSATANNQLSIGNLIFATGGFGTGTTIGSGNIGIGTSSPSTRLHVAIDPASTNTLLDVFTIDRTTTGTAGAGIGAGILFRAEDAAGVIENAAQIGGILTTVTNGSEAGALTFSTRTGGGALTERMRIDPAGNIGVLTSSPNTRLDINGDIALRVGSFTAANGDNNNINIGNFSFIRITGPTSDFTITGISGGVDGKIVYLYNATTQNMTIANESASSTDVNRIITLTGANLTTTGAGLFTLIYSSTDSRWIVISF